MDICKRFEKLDEKFGDSNCLVLDKYAPSRVVSSEIIAMRTFATFEMLASNGLFAEIGSFANESLSKRCKKKKNLYEELFRVSIFV